MRHLVARQLKSGGWHYTSDGMPVGYCADHGGHETQEDAELCYKAYLLDNELLLNRKISNQMLRCRVCKKYTDGYARVGEYHMYVLCEEHMTREHVANLFQVYESWES